MSIPTKTKNQKFSLMTLSVSSFVLSLGQKIFQRFFDVTFLSRFLIQKLKVYDSKSFSIQINYSLKILINTKKPFPKWLLFYLHCKLFGLNNFIIYFWLCF